MHTLGCRQHTNRCESTNWILGVSKVRVWQTEKNNAGHVFPQGSSDSPSVSPRHTYKGVAVQTLTMSMIRCPQALHLSADCWKPEYCNRQQRLEFHLRLSNYGSARAVNLAMLITYSHRAEKFWLQPKKKKKENPSNS